VFDSAAVHLETLVVGALIDVGDVVAFHHLAQCLHQLGNQLVFHLSSRLQNV
jgi:hypothetical protein